MPGAAKKKSSSRNKSASRSNIKSRSHKHGDKHADIERDLPNIRTNRYIARDLALALRKNANSSCLSRLTGAQRRLICEPLPNIKNEPQLLELLHTWMPIFDKAFFFSAVSSKIKSVTTYNNQDTAHAHLKEEGAWLPATQEIRIKMDIGDQPRRNAATHISILVHEMLHAFLGNFSCECRSCIMTGTRPSRLGGSGHGAVWANAMCAIAEAITRDFGFVASCGMEQSVRLEMRKTRWQPRPDQFARWKLGFIDLDDLETDSDDGDEVEMDSDDGDVVKTDSDNDDEAKMEYKVVICTVM